MTVFPSNCFSNNPNLIQVIFPNTIQEVTSTAFTGSNKKIFIYYFGDQIINDEAGFSSTGKAIVSYNYMSSTFLTSQYKIYVYKF